MSTNDAVIEATARRLYAARWDIPWEEAFTGIRDSCLIDARALAKAGLLVSELPAEPLPMRQVRLGPGCMAWQKLRDERWHSPHVATTLTDDDVRDWPVLVPETDLDEVRAERGQLVARVADISETLSSALDRVAELESRVLPAGHVAIDLSSLSDEDIDFWAGRTGSLIAASAKAERDRRKASTC